ncbi:ricin B-like lectin [Dichomitus squalens]|uniref:Ricin B-like lectin n=1 Tax=Dichomitus squalens TaxID=114155 RepID=A0A4Q9M4H0_9APHY|nr:ricin B-like lectin [Dichomitus squalens]
MAASTIENGVYFIQNVRTGTVIELAVGSSKDGTIVQGYVKRELNDVSVSAQLWIIGHAGNTGEYTIQNANSRTYLDLQGNSAPENGGHGTRVIGYHQTGVQSQRWIIKRSSKNTSYSIINGVTGTYMDLDGGSNGTPIMTFRGEGIGYSTTNENQLWHIVRA